MTQTHKFFIFFHFSALFKNFTAEVECAFLTPIDQTALKGPAGIYRLLFLSIKLST